jgi:hypothetical protein
MVLPLLVEFPGRKRMFFHALCNFVGFKRVSKKFLHFSFRKFAGFKGSELLFANFLALDLFFFQNFFLGALGSFGTKKPISKHQLL